MHITKFAVDGSCCGPSADETGPRGGREKAWGLHGILMFRVFRVCGTFPYMAFA